MPTATRPARLTDFPTSRLASGISDPRLVELMFDAAMAKAAARAGAEKCLRVGCMVLIAPDTSYDGYCRFDSVRVQLGSFPAGLSNAGGPRP